VPPARFRLASLLWVSLVTPLSAQHAATGFTLEQIKGYPFPSELTAAATGQRLVWALDERGLRNIWVAEGPAFSARRLTAYAADEGQELTSVSISADGKYVVYVRGGEHSANWPGLPPNPASLPDAPKVQIWSVPFAGGTPTLLAEGDEPAISPRSDVVAFVSGGQVSTVPIDGSAPARRLFTANGTSRDLVWSPNGTRLAFVSSRGDHAFVGIYAGEATPLLWLAPSTSRDGMPRWSPDGKRVAFVRRPGVGGAPEPILVPRPAPWTIWSADAATGTATELWRSP
jgi:Tol biopolymer transport system component